MTDIQQVENERAVALVITGPLAHTCPFKDERDEGTVTIRLSAAVTPELHDLRDYLDEWRAVGISHEELTWQIQRDLARDFGPTVMVATHWTTAGLTATVIAAEQYRRDAAGSES